LAAREDPEAGDLINAKNGILKHYTDEQGSSSTRLIGFFAALFALSQGLQRVQDNKAISQSFPRIDAKLYQLSLSNPAFLEMLKFTFLFATLFVLLTFVFRAIFRFAIYGLMASAVLAVNRNEIREATRKYVEYVNRENAKHGSGEKDVTKEDIDFHFRIHLGVVSNIREKDLKIFWLFPTRWFLEAYHGLREELSGWSICFLASAFITTVVLWFIW